MATDDLKEAIQKFHEQANEGAFTNLFLLARQRAKADGIEITEAIMAELRLRLPQ